MIQSHTDAHAALAAGTEYKKLPIPPGHVRFERHDYHYGQQGQISLIGYTLKDLPEHEAIDRVAHIGYSGCSVTWPDGYAEWFTGAHTPIRHDPHMGFGTIVRDGKEELVTLSRLPNVAVCYSHVSRITAEERATFKRYEQTS